jgi:hypothetical protein
MLIGITARLIHYQEEYKGDKMAYQYLGNPYSQQENVADQFMKGQQIYSNNQKAAMGNQDIRAEEIKRLVSIVTPENYSSVRAEGIQKGLWGEQDAPTDYESAAPVIEQIRKQFGGSASTMPSAVQEYNFYKNLPPEEQPRYIDVKRATSYLNLGDRFVQPTPTGEVKNQFDINLKPGEEPKVKKEQAQAATEGKDIGEKTSLYNSALSKLPGLNRVVNKLDKLADEATFTKGGKATDFMVNQLGYETSGATARAEYRKTVDNVVLPLLRDTFGAAFTVAEGDNLRETLGGDNLTPAQKKATLKAFIDSKYSTLEAMGNEIGRTPNLPEKPNLNNTIQQPSTKKVIDKFRSKATGEIKLIYDDGTEEIIAGN